MAGIWIALFTWANKIIIKGFIRIQICDGLGLRSVINDKRWKDKMEGKSRLFCLNALSIKRRKTCNKIPICSFFVIIGY